MTNWERMRMDSRTILTAHCYADEGEDLHATYSESVPELSPFGTS